MSNSYLYCGKGKGKKPEADPKEEKPKEIVPAASKKKPKKNDV